MRRYVAAAVFGLTLCASARAEPFLGGWVTEGDIDLIFGYLREAMAGAFEGREVPPPEALRERAEAIGRQASGHAQDAAQAALDALERDMRNSMRSRADERLPGSI